MPTSDREDLERINKASIRLGNDYIPENAVWYNTTCNAKENRERFMQNLSIVMADRQKTREGLMKVTGISEFYIDNVLAGRGRYQDVCRVSAKLGIGIVDLFFSDDILAQDGIPRLAIA